MKSRHPHGGIRVIKYCSEKYIESTSLQIQSQHWVGEHQLSM